MIVRAAFALLTLSLVGLLGYSFFLDWRARSAADKRWPLNAPCMDDGSPICLNGAAQIDDEPLLIHGRCPVGWTIDESAGPPNVMCCIARRCEYAAGASEPEP